MRKVTGFLALFIFSQLTTLAQTIVQGEANKEPSNLAITIGMKQWYTEAPEKTINGFFIGLGRMPTKEKPIFFDVNLHFIPSYNFSYRGRSGGSRTFRGDTKATQAGNINIGGMIAGRKSKSPIHPIIGIGATINFKPGYNSISPSYLENDLQIDNNGVSFGIHPFGGFIFKLSKQIFLVGKGGWSIQSNRNKFDTRAYNLYENHFFTEAALKFNFFK